MSQKLTTFLVELSKDPVKRLEFESDPAGTMQSAGLSAAEKELVLTRDAERIRTHLGVKTLAHMTCVMNGCFVDAHKELREILKNHEQRLKKLEKPAGAGAAGARKAAARKPKGSKK